MINLNARNIEVFIGGKNFTRYVSYGEFSQTLFDRAGIIRSEGKLNLIRVVDADESLDPMINQVRFARGVPVVIKISDSNNTLQLIPNKELYILNAQVKDYLAQELELTIGCWFSLNEWQTSNDPEFENEVEENDEKKSYTRSELLTYFLNKVNVTGILNNNLIGNWYGSISADLQGSYIENAGKLAFESDNPSYLICDGKIVRVVNINLTPPVYLNYVIGENEVEWNPQTAEPPVERYICTANPYLPNEDSEWEPDEDGCISRSSVGDIISEFWQVCRTPTVDSETYQLLEEENIVDPKSNNTNKVLSQRRYKAKNYDAKGRLYLETENVQRPRIAILSGVYGALGLDVPDPYGSVVAEETSINYYFKNEVTVLIIKEIRRTLGEICPEIAANYTLAANFTTKRVCEKEVTQWFKDPAGKWIKTERKYRSRILAYPSTVALLEGQGAYDMLNLAANLVKIPLGDSGIDSSTNGENTPPSPNYKSNRETTELSQKEIKGVANFEPYSGYLYRPQKIAEGLDTATTELACSNCAKILGAVLYGRYFGCSLKSFISQKFLNGSYLPLNRVDIVDTQAIKSYLSDGLAIVFDKREAFAAFSHLIWIGTVPYQPGTGVTGNRINVSTAGGVTVGSQVVFYPSPSGSVPSGLTAGFPYYVVGVDPSGILVSETPGGLPIFPGVASPAPSLPPTDPYLDPSGAIVPSEPAYGGAGFVAVVEGAIVPPYYPEDPTSGPVEIEGVFKTILKSSLSGSVSVFGVFKTQLKPTLSTLTAYSQLSTFKTQLKPVLGGSVSVIATFNLQLKSQVRMASGVTIAREYRTELKSNVNGLVVTNFKTQLKPAINALSGVAVIGNFKTELKANLVGVGYVFGEFKTALRSIVGKTGYERGIFKTNLTTYPGVAGYAAGTFRTGLKSTLEDPVFSEANAWIFVRNRSMSAATSRQIIRAARSYVSERLTTSNATPRAPFGAFKTNLKPNLIVPTLVLTAKNRISFNNNANLGATYHFVSQNSNWFNRKTLQFLTAINGPNFLEYPNTELPVIVSAAVPFNSNGSGVFISGTKRVGKLEITVLRPFSVTFVGIYDSLGNPVYENSNFSVLTSTGGKLVYNMNRVFTNESLFFSTPTGQISIVIRGI